MRHLPRQCTMFLHTHPIYLTYIQQSNFINWWCVILRIATLPDTTRHDQTRYTISHQEIKKIGTEPHIKYLELHETHIVYRFYGSLYVINEFEGVWEDQN